MYSKTILFVMFSATFFINLQMPTDARGADSRSNDEQISDEIDVQKLVKDLLSDPALGATQSEKNTTFSFRAKLKRPTNRGREHPWMYSVFSCIEGKSRFMATTANGLPYSIISNGNVVNLSGNNGQTASIYEGGGFRYRIGAANDGSLRLQLIYHRKFRGRGHVVLHLPELVRGARNKAKRIEYSPNERELAFHSANGGVFRVYLADRDGSFPITGLTLEIGGEKVIVVSQIRTEGVETIPDPSKLIAFWSATGHRVVYKKLRESMMPKDIFPSDDYRRSQEAKKFMKRILKLAGEWPTRGMNMAAKTPDVGPGEELPSWAKAKRLISSPDWTVYEHIEVIKDFATSDDPKTRAWAMFGLGLKNKNKNDVDAIAAILKKGISDSSLTVRINALNSLATHMKWDTFPLAETRSAVYRRVEKTTSPIELRNAVVTLRYATDEDAFPVKNFPKTETGWAANDDSAIAWWMIHGKEIKEKLANYKRSRDGKGDGSRK